MARFGRSQPFRPIIRGVRTSPGAVGDGASVGTSTATAIGFAVALSLGSGIGGTTVLAVGSSVVVAVGNAASSSSASAPGASGFRGVGSSTGTASGTATGFSSAVATSSSVGGSTALAVGSSTVVAVGNAAGSSTSTAPGASAFRGTGTVAGTSSVTATGSSSFIATGSAAGTSSVTGIAVPQTPTGTAIGTSTSLAVGRSTVLAVGNAAGISTITATGQSFASGVGSLLGLGGQSYPISLGVTAFFPLGNPPDSALFVDTTGRGNSLTPNLHINEDTGQFRMGRNSCVSCGFIQQVFAAMSRWGKWNRKLTNAEFTALIGNEDYPFSTTPSLNTAIDTFYRLNEGASASTFVDATGNGNNQTVTGANGVTTGPAGGGDTAIVLDTGIWGTVVAPTAPLRSRQHTITICGKVKLNGKPTGAMMQQVFWGQLNNDTGESGFNVYYDPTADRFCFDCDAGDGTDLSQGTLVIESSLSPTIGTWYFVAAELDVEANEIRISINNGTRTILSNVLQPTPTAGTYGNASEFRLNPTASFATRTNGWDSGVLPIAGNSFLGRAATTDLSIGNNSKAVWIRFKTSAPSVYQTIGGFYDDAAAKHTDWIFQISGNVLYFVFGKEEVYASVAMSDTNWHLAIGWYDKVAGRVKLSLDGATSGAGFSDVAGPATPQTSLAQFRIGSDSSGAGNAHQFQGSLELFGAGTGVPTTDDIAVLWNAGDGWTYTEPGSGATSTAIGVGKSTALSAGNAIGSGSSTAVSLSDTRSPGAATGLSTAIAVGKSTVLAVGNATGTSTVLAVGKSSVLSQASSNGTAIATAIGQTASLSTGSSTGSSTVTANGISTVRSPGVATGSSTTSAVGQSSIVGVGNASGTSTPLAVGRSAPQGQAAATGLATVTAVGKSVVVSVGNASGTSAVTGIKEQGFSLASATGSSTVTAIGSSTVTAVGSASSTSTASAPGASKAQSQGASTGTSTVIATGKSSTLAVGSVTSTSTAIAVTSPQVGNALGSATVTAVGKSTVLAIGNAASIATASATSFASAQSLGTVTGIAVVTSVGKSHITAVGLIAGTSSANGFYNAALFKGDFHETSQSVAEVQRTEIASEVIRTVNAVGTIYSVTYDD